MTTLSRWPGMRMISLSRNRGTCACRPANGGESCDQARAIKPVRSQGEKQLRRRPPCSRGGRAAVGGVGGRGRVAGRGCGRRHLRVDWGSKVPAFEVGLPVAVQRHVRAQRVEMDAISAGDPRKAWRSTTMSGRCVQWNGTGVTEVAAACGQCAKLHRMAGRCG